MSPKQSPLRAECSGLRPIDIHFADFMVWISGSEDVNFWVAAALVSSKAGEGHSCVPLSDFSDCTLFSDEQIRGLKTPKLDLWRKALVDNNAVAPPGARAPLILDENNRLYLQRYWQIECFVSSNIRSRLLMVPAVDMDKLKSGLQRLFGGSRHENAETDWQQVSAAVSVLRSFSVISGGPGTGKTSTVTNILALLIEQSYPEIPRIALAASTGKAAVRLGEAVKKAKTDLAVAQEILRAIPDRTYTLHRLLGVIPGRAGFRHNAENPLVLDVLVVDEASMVDLALMSRVLDALDTDCRLIILGDRDQLASVEPGNVFADICNAGNGLSFSDKTRRQLLWLMDLDLPQQESASSPISDSITVLDKSYRFSHQSGIGKLANAVKLGDTERCQRLFEDKTIKDIKWHSLRAINQISRLIESTVERYRMFLQEDEPGAALQRFNEFRVLCALRHGPFGVIELNRRIEAALGNAGLIHHYPRWYKGQPILATCNDYRLNIFNGDVGVVLPDQESNGRLRAFFLSPEGMIRKFLLDHLPDHETAFAMTVHKSQGSEFNEVFCVLPDLHVPILTRELIYTVVSRAKIGLTIWGNWAVFKTAISRCNRRYSGLSTKLREPNIRKN